MGHFQAPSNGHRIDTSRRHPGTGGRRFTSSGFGDELPGMAHPDRLATPEQFVEAIIGLTERFDHERDDQPDGSDPDLDLSYLAHFVVIAARALLARGDGTVDEELFQLAVEGAIREEGTGNVIRGPWPRRPTQRK
jgi:hypothetical protein